LSLKIYVLKAYILKIPEKVVKINIFLVYEIVRGNNSKKEQLDF
jgi:hypothetical protein